MRNVKRDDIISIKSTVPMKQFLRISFQCTESQSGLLWTNIRHPFTRKKKRDNTTSNPIEHLIMFPFSLPGGIVKSPSGTDDVQVSIRNSSLFN